MNTYIFIGHDAPPLQAIPVGCWAERDWNGYWYIVTHWRTHDHRGICRVLR